MMKFNEASLEHAVIDLFSEVGIEHLNGQSIHRLAEEVLILDDFSKYLENRYAQNEITEVEIQSIIRKIQSIPTTPVYDSNRIFMDLFLLNILK